MKFFKSIFVLALISCFTAGAEETTTSRKYFTFDLGLSTGSYGGKNYFEYNLGVNFFPITWISWRNAFFYRSQQDSYSYYGLDSSLRGHAYLAFTEASGLVLHAGAGSRFPNEGDITPFLEAGGGISATNLFIGAGVKHLLHSLVRKGAENETILMISLAARGAF